jgi:hypothetical protein
VKGQLEEKIKELPFRSIHIFQPSVLLGQRGESRPGEEMAKSITNALKFALVGGLRKYRPIQAKKVAECMFSVARNRDEGVHIYSSEQLEAM